MANDTWTDTDSLTSAQLERAFACARGCYQEVLLRGLESSSGSTLRGTAASYRSRYAKSRLNLYTRLERAGFDVQREQRGHRLVLVVRPTQDLVAW